MQGLLSIRRRLLIFLLPALALLMLLTGLADFLTISAAESAADTAGNAQLTPAEIDAGRARTRRLLLAGKLLLDFVQLDITLLLVWFGIQFGLRPLQLLRAQVEARTPRELKRFDEEKVSAEVRPLIAAFNRLLELLQEAANSQRRFVADAAHQLRTPVAGLLAQMELLLREPQAADLGPRLTLMYRGLQQLSHSSNQLLILARAEPAASSPGTFRPVQLDALVQQQVERNIDRAEKLQLDLGAEAGAATVSGDSRLLEDLLNNLVDNALKYTPAGGRVTVRSGWLENRPYLEVEDDGIGIPETERRRVRERFYRSDGSVAEGCGLGLAIVEEIARLHKAVFTIATGHAGAGCRMVVQFPGPPPADVKRVS
jgi:two-component system sensor histidine kinase TctE